MRTSNSDVIGQVSRKLKPVLLRIRNWIHLLKYFLNGSSVGHISEDALHRFWLVLRWVTRQTYGQLVAAAGCRHQLRSYNSFKYNMPLSAQTHASVIRHDHSYRTMTLEQSASRHSPAYLNTGQFLTETKDIFCTSRHQCLVTVLGTVYKLSYLLTCW